MVTPAALQVKIAFGGGEEAVSIHKSALDFLAAREMDQFPKPPPLHYRRKLEII